MNLQANSQFNQYRIVRLLGRGGVGEVYEAEHTTLDCRYALKLLPEDFAGRSEAVARFWQEALVLAKLEHPHIVRVDEFGEVEGRYWLRMELVHGVEPQVVSLGDYAALHSGKIEQGELVLMLKQILEGLAHAHSNGVFHGNLKPENILLEKTAVGALHVKISDFGLAWVQGKEPVQGQVQIGGSPISGSAKATGAKQLVGDENAIREGEDPLTRALPGTWDYLSPEQRRGEEADARSDVYAVGLICCRLLTGKDLRRITVSELGAAEAWNKFLAKAITHEPSARYANGREMLEAFRVLDDVAGAEVKTPKSTTTYNPWAQRGKPKQPLALAVITLTLFLLSISCFSFWWWLHHQERKPIENLPAAVGSAVNPKQATGGSTSTPLVRKTGLVRTDGTPSNPVRYSYLSPTKPTPGDRTAAAVEFTQARLVEQNGQLPEALKHYREAVNLDPAWFEAQFDTGVLAHQLRDYPLALRHYELALALQPDAVDARYNFALALKAAGYAPDAADELKKLLAAHPGEVRGQLALANLCAQSLHDMASARQHYLKVLELDPKNPQASFIRLWLAKNSP